MQLTKDFATLIILFSVIYTGAVKFESKAKEPEPTVAEVAVVEPVREVIPREMEARYEETIQQYAERRVTEVFGGGQWESFNQIVTNESHWNPNAQNRTSTAFGLGQFLNQTWAGTGIAKTSDPKQQIEAMLIYVKNRYSTPQRAWSHWVKYHWY